MSEIELFDERKDIQIENDIKDLKQLRKEAEDNRPFLAGNDGLKNIDLPRLEPVGPGFLKDRDAAFPAPKPIRAAAEAPRMQK